MMGLGNDWGDFFLIFFLFHLNVRIEGAADPTFYIRHHSGKCLTYDASKRSLVFQTLCSEKFQWKSGARLFHVKTNRCISPVSAAAGSSINITNDCSGTDSLLTYNQSQKVLQHLITDFCFQPKTGSTSPAENEALTFNAGCASDTNKYYFIPNAYYVIRHYTSSLCWVFDKALNRFKLMNTYVCDRFEYVNSKHLRHVASGKCIQGDAEQLLTLTSNCSSTKSVFNMLPTGILNVPGENKCIHPNGGSDQPAEGTFLILWSCFVADYCKWKLYDDRDILDIQVLSESCDEYPTNTDCAIPKGHIVVNGYQYSPNIRGINLALFDYKSGILETKRNYDVHLSSTYITELANYLNLLPSGKLLLMAAKDSIGMSAALALALQRVGVSATFATTNLPKDRLSLATVLYTGSQRYSWEKSINKVGGTGASTLNRILYTFRDFEGIDECYEEMGLRTGKLPDDRLTSKYVYRGNPTHWAPHFARLHNTHSWCGGTTMSADYIQVDLGSVKTISGIASQVYRDRSILHNIQRFYITYSIDGITWKEYTGYGSTREELVGLKNYQRSVKVNWLARVQLRFLRVIPLARYTDLNTHCLRMELFGCDLRETIINDHMFSAESYRITDHSVGGLSVHGFATDSKNVSIQVTTAEKNSSLADHIDQFHFHAVNESFISSNGSVERDTAKVTKIVRNKLGMNSELKFDYSSIQTDHYKFAAEMRFWVIDSQVKSGPVWNTYTYETANSIVAYARPIEIKRGSPDHAVILFNANKVTKNPVELGDQILVDTSLIPWVGGTDRSSANAFQLETFIYYDSQFLTLQSMNALDLTNVSLYPSYNTSKAGFIHLKNDVFGPFNKQFVQLMFQFTVPQHVLKWQNCAGQILFDFKYRTNSAAFNGTWNKTLAKVIDYKCKIKSYKKTSITAVRLSVAKYSVTYDDVNTELVVCQRRMFKESAHLPSCYSQGKNNITWVGLPGIASVVGFDTAKGHLYGIDLFGKGYMRSTHLSGVFAQIDDSEWTSIRDLSNVRKAKETSDIVSLPNEVSSQWLLPTSSDAVISITKRGVQRKIDGAWKRIFEFDSHR